MESHDSDCGTPTGGVETVVAVGAPSRADGSFGACLCPCCPFLVCEKTRTARGGLRFPPCGLMGPVREDGKVVVHFRNVGGAPVLAQNKFKVNGSEKIWKLHQMLRDKLGRELEEGASLFLYCNSAFAPALDERISDVATCFHVNGTLELNYAITPAWG